MSRGSHSRSGSACIWATNGSTPPAPGSPSPKKSAMPLVWASSWRGVSAGAVGAPLMVVQARGQRRRQIAPDPAVQIRSTGLDQRHEGGRGQHLGDARRLELILGPHGDAGRRIGEPRRAVPGEARQVDVEDAAVHRRIVPHRPVEALLQQASPEPGSVPWRDSTVVWRPRPRPGRDPSTTVSRVCAIVPLGRV